MKIYTHSNKTRQKQRLYGFDYILGLFNDTI